MTGGRVIRILFVCMGNICRSPTVEGVFRGLVHSAGLNNHIATDSAGTHSYHEGAPPDRRAIEAAARRGFNISDIRARRVKEDDFRQFNMVLAMDRENLGHLAMLCPPDAVAWPKLLLEFAPKFQTQDMPDPYYGGLDGFERVLDMAEVASRGLLEHLRLVQLIPNNVGIPPNKNYR